MKTFLFLLASFLPAIAFAEPNTISETFNCRFKETNLVECEKKSSTAIQSNAFLGTGTFQCRLNEANLLECEVGKYRCHLDEESRLTECKEKFTSHYYQNKIVENTEERETEIRLLIDTNLLFPMLEKSLRKGGNGVKIHSLRVQDLNKSPNDFRISFTFTLKMFIATEASPPLNAVCSVEVYGDTHLNALIVGNCFEERIPELLNIYRRDRILSINHDEILSISNHKNYDDSSPLQFNYHRPIIRVTQQTIHHGEGRTSKMEVGVYQER